MENLAETPIEWALIIGNMLFALAIFLLLIYVVQVQGYQSRTKKFKFVSEREIRAMQGASALFASSLAFFAFVLFELSIGSTGLVAYVFSALFGIAVGLVIGSVLRVYLKYYHPFILEKRLTDIRFGPMKSPKTGKPMKLLNEAQEDVHLSREMIEEEDTLSVDYDVWIDQETDYKVIERYDTRFHPLVCESCNFRTLMERKEEIVNKPTQHKKGLLRKHYECSYCGHIEAKDVTIPSWDEEGKFDGYEKDVIETPTFKNRTVEV